MKDSLNVYRAITRAIKLLLYTAGHESCEKRQIPVSSISCQGQNVDLPLDGVSLRLCPTEI